MQLWKGQGLALDKTVQVLIPVLFPMSNATLCNSLNHPKLSLIPLLTQDNTTLVLSRALSQYYHGVVVQNRTCKAVVSLPLVQSSPNKCQLLLFSAINAEAQPILIVGALHKRKLKEKLLQRGEMLVFISVHIAKCPTICSQVSSSQPNDTL